MSAPQTAPASKVGTPAARRLTITTSRPSRSECRLARVYTGSYYRMTDGSTLITRIYTEEGVVGEAYAGDEDDGNAEIERVGGGTPEADAERFIRCRRAAGEDFILVADANQGWTVRQAVRFAARLPVTDLQLYTRP